MEKRITQVLRDVCIFPNLSGYAYLKTAIAICLENPNAINAVVSVLYPSIAEIHGTTPTSVERAIRHAIKHSLACMDESAKREYFSIGRYKMTGSLFISALTEYLRVEETQTPTQSCVFCNDLSATDTFFNRPICEACKTGLRRVLAK